MRGRGSPPGPVGFWTTRLAAAPLGPAASAPIGVVVFSHPASTPAAPSPMAAPMDLVTSWRRLRPDRSFGCDTSTPLSPESRQHRPVLGAHYTLGKGAKANLLEALMTSGLRAAPAVGRLDN